MKIELLDPGDQRWCEVLRDFRHDIYHSPEYVALEAQRIQAKPEAIWMQEGSAQFFLPYLVRDCVEVFADFLAAGEIYDAVSPYGYPGMLWNQASLANPQFSQQAFQALQQTLCDRKICSLFVRNHPILNASFPAIFQEQGLVFGGNTISIDLTLPKAKLWSETRRGHQSTINKCKRLGYVGEFLDPKSYLDDFLDIYYETMNRVEAKSNYFFGEDYFRALCALGDTLQMGVVKFEDTITSASLFFETNGIVQAHLAGTKTEYLEDSPFSLLLDTARLWAKQRGNQYLHIGGGVGAAEDSLYRFKAGFSKQRHEFWMMKCVIDSDRYNNLVNLQEKILGHPLETSFFPAYRLG